MRKVTSKVIEKTEYNIKPLKNPPALDDNTIRGILRNGCRELQEEVSEIFMTDNIRVWLVQPLAVPSEPNWVDPDFLADKTDLILLWSIYAQRQVLTFDQESKMMENWEQQSPW
jgi:hypothetical protein